MVKVQNMGRTQYNTMIEIGNVIVSSECITEYFCCDLDACKGECCIEGDAGAPITTEEKKQIEEALPFVKDKLSHAALNLIHKQGVAYKDRDGDLVTSIVKGKNCVFTFMGDGGCCLCALERAYAEGKTKFVKPISCALYPIRASRLSNGMTALNYNRWNICACARKLGNKNEMRVYEFLKAPLIRAFGEEWYGELDTVAKELVKQKIL